MKSLDKNFLSEKRAGWPFNEYNEFEVTVQPMTSIVYKIKVFGPIEDTTQFSAALEAFERAGPDDRVLIHLSTPGGSVDAADTFITAMHNCEAPVHVAASGTVASAGTIILLNAPSFSLSENFVAMFHNGSYGTYGKHHEVASHQAFTAKYMERLCRDTYEGFFDETELQALIDGKDFWMEKEEFGKRFESRAKLVQERHPCACGSCTMNENESLPDLAAFMATMGQDIDLEEPVASKKPARKRAAKTKAG